MFPEGLSGLLVHIVEEILDEWVARVMVHYRWHYAENTHDVLVSGFGVDVSLEEAQFLIMKARIELGIVDPNEILAEAEAAEAEGEDGELVEEQPTT